MPERLDKDSATPLAHLLEQADGLIETSLAESDRAVEELLEAIEAFHAASGAAGHRQAAERIVVAMQFYDLLCQRLRLVQTCLDECRQLSGGSPPAAGRPGDGGIGRIIDGLSSVQGHPDRRTHGGKGSMEFFP